MLLSVMFSLFVVGCVLSCMLFCCAGSVSCFCVFCITELGLSTTINQLGCSSTLTSVGLKLDLKSISYLQQQINLPVAISAPAYNVVDPLHPEVYLLAGTFMASGSSRCAWANANLWDAEAEDVEQQALGELPELALAAEVQALPAEEQAVPEHSLPEAHALPEQQALQEEQAWPQQAWPDEQGGKFPFGVLDKAWADVHRAAVGEEMQHEDEVTALFAEEGRDDWPDMDIDRQRARDSKGKHGAALQHGKASGSGGEQLQDASYDDAEVEDVEVEPISWTRVSLRKDGRLRRHKRAVLPKDHPLVLARKKDNNMRRK